MATGILLGMFSGLQVSVVGLERALHQYTLEPSETPFDLKSVPLATQPLVEQKASAGKCSNSIDGRHHFISCFSFSFLVKVKF